MKTAILPAAALLWARPPSRSHAGAEPHRPRKTSSTRSRSVTFLRFSPANLPLRRTLIATPNRLRKTMIKDHQKKSKELKADRQGKVQANLPTGLDSEHQKMLDELKTKDGRDFDVAYDQIQLKAHQNAVRCSRRMPKPATTLT
jgi:Domain of unknown function (DUF4142)